MKIRIAAFVVFIAALCLVTPLRAADGVKIAVANPAKIFTEMQETKDLKQKMEGDRKGLEATDREKKEKLKSLQEARDQLKSDSPQYQERNQELLKAAIEFKAWGDLMQADIQRNQKMQMKTLFEKISRAVNEVAKQKGVDLVIAEQRPDFPENLDQVNVDQLRALINQRNVLYANEKVDISNDVIAALDSKYKGGK